MAIYMNIVKVQEMKARILHFTCNVYIIPVCIPVCIPVYELFTFWNGHKN